MDFSEKYIAWYTFQQISEENLKTGRVRASQLGEGYDTGLSVTNDPNTADDFGGLFFGAFKQSRKRIIKNEEVNRNEKTTIPVPDHPAPVVFHRLFCERQSTRRE